MWTPILAIRQRGAEKYEGVVAGVGLDQWLISSTEIEAGDEETMRKRVRPEMNNIPESIYACAVQGCGMKFQNAHDLGRHDAVSHGPYMAMIHLTSRRMTIATSCN